MKKKLLTPQDIQLANKLRREKGLGKRRLAIYFGVSSTAIWENVYNTNYKRPKRPRRITIIDDTDYKSMKKCPICEKYITRVINGKTIPVNLQVGNMCITCYLRSIGLEYMDLL